jgi:XTP/dITP diphosphohydrolase
MNEKIFLASGNPGKLAEFFGLAGPGELPTPRLDLALLPDFSSLPAFDESAPTFAEIAAGKALHYSRLVGALILADDSGLVVPALGGRPGVRSARYGGPDATSAERNERLLREMRNFAGGERRAYFVCALALARRGRAIAIVTARADGEILHAPRGARGFGYDPIFYVRDRDQTFAELPMEQKNQLSHRGKAFRRMAQFISAI